MTSERVRSAQRWLLAGRLGVACCAIVALALGAVWLWRVDPQRPSAMQTACVTLWPSGATEQNTTKSQRDERTFVLQCQPLPAEGTVFGYEANLLFFANVTALYRAGIVNVTLMSELAGYRVELAGPEYRSAKTTDPSTGTVIAPLPTEAEAETLAHWWPRAIRAPWLVNTGVEGGSMPFMMDNAQVRIWVWDIRWGELAARYGWIVLVVGLVGSLASLGAMFRGERLLAAANPSPSVSGCPTCGGVLTRTDGPPSCEACGWSIRGDANRTGKPPTT